MVVFLLAFLQSHPTRHRYKNTPINLKFSDVWSFVALVSLLSAVILHEQHRMPSFLTATPDLLSGRPTNQFDCSNILDAN